jgi:hypothetical protein
MGALLSAQYPFFDRLMGRTVDSLEVIVIDLLFIIPMLVFAIFGIWEARRQIWRRLKKYGRAAVWNGEIILATVLIVILTPFLPLWGALTKSGRRAVRLVRKRIVFFVGEMKKEVRK